MKNLIISAGLLFSMLYSAAQTEYKVITAVESIVPMGLGRSRLIESHDEKDLNQLTTERTSGTDGKQGKVKRGDVKVDNITETKLLNFYSGVGINFQNVASNDAVITAKLNELTALGWELAFVVSGVESVGSRDDNNGIYITRYIFKRDSE